jgi:hypothetical protein
VGDANKRLFEKTPACLKDGRVLGNLGYASLWGVKVTDSEIGRDGFISNQSRLAAVRRVGRYRRVNVSYSGLAGDVSLWLAVGRIALCMM